MGAGRSKNANLSGPFPVFNPLSINQFGLGLGALSPLGLGLNHFSACNPLACLAQQSCTVPVPVPIPVQVPIEIPFQVPIPVEVKNLTINFKIFKNILFKTNKRFQLMFQYHVQLKYL